MTRRQQRYDHDHHNTTTTTTVRAMGTNGVQVVCALVIFILYNFYLSLMTTPALATTTP